MVDLGIVFNEDGVLLDWGGDEINIKFISSELDKKNTNHLTTHLTTDFELGLIE